MIYFIQAGDKIKIGYARSLSAVRSRYGTIRNASPVPARILGATEGTERDEKALHKRFRAHQAEGEWFAAVPEILELAAQSTVVSPAPGTRLSFRCDEELVRRVDAVRGDVARELWLRKAVQAATDAAIPAAHHMTRAVEPYRSDLPSPAPAEQPLDRAAMFRRATQRKEK